MTWPNERTAKALRRKRHDLLCYQFPARNEAEALWEAKTHVLRVFGLSAENSNALAVGGGEESLAIAANVIGVGVGLKIIDGRVFDPPRACVTVYVRRKQRLEELPSWARIPLQINGVLTDVVEEGVARAAIRGFDGFSRTAGYQRDHWPIVSGLSIGPDTARKFGTSGCVVQNSEKERFILTCNHVVGLPPGQPSTLHGILQPGYHRRGSSAGPKIGVVADFHPISYVPTSPVRKHDGPVPYNPMDAAIVALRPEPAREGAASPEIYRLGAPRTTPIAPRRGLRVQKSGAGSGCEQGTIDSIERDCETLFDEDRHLAFFSNVIRITNIRITKRKKRPFATDGDSGTLVVSFPERHPVALLFAATEEGHGIAVPIQRILDRFGVTIVSVS